MSQTKRRPVFQSSEEDQPVKIDPPMQLPEDDLADLVGDDAPEPIEQAPEPPPVIEQKELKGWKVLGPEQQTGKHFRVTTDIEQDGVLAYWRKTRKMQHFRWVLNGRWSDPLTNKDITPQPTLYKEIHA